MTSKPLVIGTRGSALALWQANHVADRLRAREPGLELRLEIIKTKGDKILDVALSKVGGKGLFVKEIEDALLDGRVDLAVHSMKDVPAELPAGLVIAGIPERADPHDALCVRAGGPPTLLSLGKGAHVGTSSLRRMCQLRAERPDLKISPLRGNVDTRLRKLDDGEYDAIVLAAAGLTRLGLADRITEKLAFDVMLPAIGQGALGIECRAADTDVVARIAAALHDPASASAVTAERALLARLQGGCQTPIAAHAVPNGELLTMDALIAMPDGSRTLRDKTTGPRERAVALGRELAERLLAAGGQTILDAARAAEEPTPAAP